MDQRRKIGCHCEGNMKMSGLDREETNKIAKPFERRAISHAQETPKEMDLGDDSDPVTGVIFSVNSSESGDSSLLSLGRRTISAIN